MNKFTRYLLLMLIVGLLSVGMAQVAATQDGIKLIKTFSQDWGRYKIEAVQMCANGTEAVVAAVGPGSLDDLLLFKFKDVNTADPKYDKTTRVFFGDNDFFGPGPGPYEGTGIHAGMGPRGLAGMSITIDPSCRYAYLANPFLDSVVKVDLIWGAKMTAEHESSSVHCNDGTIVWPKDFCVIDYTALGDQVLNPKVRMIGKPKDAKLTLEGDRLLVSSTHRIKELNPDGTVKAYESDNAVYVLDAQTGKQLAKIPTKTGPFSIAVVGSGYAFVVVNGRGQLACINLSRNEIHTVNNVERNPFMVVTSNDGQRAYVSNTGTGTVSVLEGLGCEKRVIATVKVGNTPRHLALSPDNHYLYVSNATDNTVSIIDTRTLKVVETIQVVPTGEPAPVGVVAISNNNRYLYVFWEGGLRGTPGRMQLKVYDVCRLYGPGC